MSNYIKALIQREGMTISLRKYTVTFATCDWDIPMHSEPMEFDMQGDCYAYIDSLKAKGVPIEEILDLTD
jgi:hypothetical protein